MEVCRERRGPSVAGEAGSLADPSPPPSLPGSAKSRLTLLSERPGPEPGHPACTQSCPQPPEPGEGTPDPQDHPYHEVRFPWEHPGSYQRQAYAVEEAYPERGSHAGHPHHSPGGS